MKNLLTALALFFIMTCMNAQDVKGYYLGVGGKRVEGLFRKTNFGDAKRLEFRTSENESYGPLPLEVTSEYGADGRKFVKSTVEMDITGGSAAAVSNGKDPVLEKNTLFLEVLVHSNASLYLYADGSNYRYFYNVADRDAKIKQLIYKKYFYQGATVAENTFFRQQLAIDVLCANDRNSKYANLAYNRSTLIPLFQEYNRCTGFESVVAEERKEKASKFVLSVFAGGGSTTTKSLNAPFNVDVKANGFAYYAGGEIALKIKYSGFSVFGKVHVTRISGDGNKQYQLGTTYTVVNKLKVDLTEFNAALGARHTFAVGGTDRIFLEAAIGAAKPTGDITLDYGTYSSTEGGVYRLNIKPDPNMFFTFGGGLCLTKNISAGVYYISNRSLSNHYIVENSVFTGAVKYTFL